jgi:hypothetical protein
MRLEAALGLPLVPCAAAITSAADALDSVLQPANDLAQIADAVVSVGMAAPETATPADALGDDIVSP